VTKLQTLVALALVHSVEMIAEAYEAFEESCNPWPLAETVRDALEHSGKYLDVWAEDD
jgi:hypothetical protein